MIAALAAGLAAGLASAPHCAGMCGPITAAVCGGPRRGSLRYHTGRFLSYTAVGALVGYSGGQVASSLGTGWWTALVSWSLALACLVWGLRLGRSGRGAGLDRLAQVRTKKASPPIFLRVVRVAIHKPGWIGMATVLLPCGTLFAAFLLAASTGGAIKGAIVMASFASVSGIGLLSSDALWRILRRRFDERFTHLAAAAFLVAGLVLALRPVVALLDASPCCGTHHNAAATSN